MTNLYIPVSGKFEKVFADDPNPLADLAKDYSLAEHEDGVPLAEQEPMIGYGINAVWDSTDHAVNTWDQTPAAIALCSTALDASERANAYRIIFEFVGATDTYKIEMPMSEWVNIDPAEVGDVLVDGTTGNAQNHVNEDGSQGPIIVIGRTSDYIPLGERDDGTNEYTDAGEVTTNVRTLTYAGGILEYRLDQIRGDARPVATMRRRYGTQPPAPSLTDLEWDGTRAKDTRTPPLWYNMAQSLPSHTSSLSEWFWTADVQFDPTSESYTFLHGRIHRGDNGLDIQYSPDASTWYSTYSSTRDVYFRERLSGGSWGPATVLHSHADRKVGWDLLFSDVWSSGDAAGRYSISPAVKLEDHQFIGFYAQWSNGAKNRMIIPTFDVQLAARRTLADGEYNWEAGTTYKVNFQRGQDTSGYRRQSAVPITPADDDTEQNFLVTFEVPSGETVSEGNLGSILMWRHSNSRTETTFTLKAYVSG